MSTYLERNTELIAELNTEIRKGLPLPSVYVEKSLSGTVFSRGSSYDSKILQRRLSLGLKENSKRNAMAPFFELAFLKLLLDAAPHYEPEIPIIYASVGGESGKGMRLLVEDFSSNGEHTVWPMSYSGRLPTDIRLVNPRLSDEDLQNASFYIKDAEDNVTRKIGDFDKLMPWGDPEFETVFEQVLAQKQDYTVSLA